MGQDLSGEMPYTMTYVLDLCQAKIKKHENHKGEVEILCPLTENKTFEVNVRKDNWNCFRKCSDCPGGGGILDLYMLFSGAKTRSQAHKEIMQSINGSVENANLARQMSAKHREPVKQSAKLSPEILNNTYQKFLDMLVLEPQHQADLKKRGIHATDIIRMGFKSVPGKERLDSIASALVKKGAILQGVPGFYFEDGVPHIATFGTGYFIPYRNRDGMICGLQIRYDIKLDPKDEEQNRKLKKRRYRWFTSSHKENGASGENLPFWGIPGRPVSKVAYATEGGLKASVAQSLSDGYFVAIPGVTCFSTWRQLLSGLKQMGVTMIVDAFDSDRATKPEVANAISKLYAIAKDYGFDMKPWDWGTEQKGVDDYLLARHLQRQKQQAQKASS